MEASGHSCISELNSLKCVASVITTKGKEISHLNLGLRFNLGVNKDTSSYSLLSDPVKMAPPILQEARDIKHDTGKQEPSPQSHVSINVSSVAGPTERLSVLGGENRILMIQLVRRLRCIQTVLVTK